MKQIKTNTYVFIFVVISASFLLSCNQPAAITEKNNKDTMLIAANENAFSIPAYDPTMEPLTVGAKFIKKLGDTLGIKMYEFTVKPGD